MVDKDLQGEMLIWSLILEKIVSLTELETTWNLDDAHRAYAVIQIRRELLDNQTKKTKEK